MADDSDNIKANAEAINNALNSVNDGLEKTGKNMDEVAKKTVKNLTLIERTLPKIGKQFSDMGKKVKPLSEGIRGVNNSLEEARDNTKGLDRAINKAFGQNNKAVTGALVAVRKYANAMKDSAIKAKDLSGQMDVLQDVAKVAANTIDQLSSELKKASDEVGKINNEVAEANNLLKEGSLTVTQYGWAMEEITDRLNKAKAAEAGLSETVVAAQQSQKIAISSYEKKALQLQRLRVETIKNRDAAREEMKEQMRSNAEVQMASGGIESLIGAAKKASNEKIFKFMDMAQNGAMLGVGFGMMHDSLKQTSQMLAATSAVSLTLGKDAKTGLGGLASSVVDAQVATTALIDVTSSLGMDFEKVSAAASRLRSNLRFDKEGQLSEQAIGKMTKAAAQFSKVSGVDMETSVAMIEKRVKNFGMTAEQAVANVDAMRISIKQMMVGVKTEVVSMDEMVNLIEEASDASQAYVVDTRLLTQALRGAATQAANLGANQKQAKDVTQAIGKIMGNAPDFIKIPAGYDLLSQLTGGDSGEFLEKFDSSTKKQLTEIKEAFAKGEIDQYTASRAVMDATAGSEAGQEATMKRLSSTVLGSTAAAEIIAETYGIENRATAFQLQKILKDTNKFQATLESQRGYKMSFASAMAKDVVVFEEMIHGMEDASKSTAEQVKALKEKGLSETDATRYLEVRKKGIEDVARLKSEYDLLADDKSEAAAKRRAELEMQMYEAGTLAQAEMLDQALNPAKKFMKEMSQKLGKPVEISTEITNKELIANELKTGKALADMYGLKDQKHIDALQKLYDKEQSVSAEQLENMRKQESEANQQQMKIIEDIGAKFQNGLGEGLKHIVQGWMLDAAKWVTNLLNIDPKWASLFGPLTTGILGLGAAVAGVWMLWKQTGSMVEKAVYRGVLAGIKGSGGLDGGDIDLDGDPSGKKKGKKNKNRKTKGGKLGGIKGLMSGMKSNWAATGAKGLLKTAGKMAVPAALAGGIELFSDRDKIADGFKNRGAKAGISQMLPGILAAAGGIGGGALGSLVAPGVGTIGGGIAGGAAGRQLGEWLSKKMDDSEGASATGAATDKFGTAANTLATVGEQLKAQTAPGLPPSAIAASGGGVGGMGGFGTAMLGAGSSIMANAGPNAFDPTSGKATLEITNFADLMTSFKDAASRSGIRY